MVKEKGSKLEMVFNIVPFTVRKDGLPDYEGLVSNIEFLASSGLHNVIKYGCMGEFCVPAFIEYKRCVRLCVKTTNKRITTLVGAIW